MFAPAGARDEDPHALTSVADLMPEVAHASEKHGNPEAIGRGNHLWVSRRAAGLDNCRSTGPNAGLKPVREREKSIARKDRA